MKAILEIGNKKFLFDSVEKAANLAATLAEATALESSYVYNQDLEILGMTDCKDVYWKGNHSIDISIKEDFQLLPMPLKDYIKGLKQKTAKEPITAEKGAE